MAKIVTPDLPKKAKDVVPEGRGFYGPKEPTGGSRPAGVTNGQGRASTGRSRRAADRPA